jgi:hypothetical protein
MTKMRKRIVIGFLLTLSLACAHGRYLPGTTIPASEENRDILETIESYRMKLVQKDVDGLLLLASNHYFEDGGTVQAGDDYGFEGLRTILTGRLQRVQSIRYDIEYRSVQIKGDRAEVEVFLNGAFDVQGEAGERYRRVSDIHKFVLERAKDGGSSKWRFLSGM